MQIREYRESDLATLRAIHAAQGFDYALPDLRNPLFLTRLVLTHDSEGLNVAPPFRAASSPLAQTSTARAAELPPATPRQTNHDAENHGAKNCSTETSLSAREGNCRAEQASAAGPILGAVLLRLTAEAYLLLDPHAGTPRQRWQWLLTLQEAARRDAWQRGLEDVHAWLPPPIAQKFGRRLTQLGWLRDDSWTPYCKRLTSPG